MKPANENSLLQLHLAEYQALTTRASYWIVLQVSLVPAVPVYLALAAQVWQAGVIVKGVVVWATLAGLQLIGIVWSQLMLEEYAAVRYIEFYLRPLIKNVVGSDLFWGYEPYLVKHRLIRQGWGEASISVLGLIVFLITLAARIPEFSRWDAAGAVINLVILRFLWKHSNRARKARREWSAFDTKN